MQCMWWQKKGETRVRCVVCGGYSGCGMLGGAVDNDVGKVGVEGRSR